MKKGILIQLPAPRKVFLSCMLLCVGAFGMSFCGCAWMDGYSNESLFPRDVSTVCLKMFDNQSFRRGVEYELSDALATVLTTVRGIARGRLIAVFGCGGDRDQGKRPMMAEVGTRLADLSILTTDNLIGEGADNIGRGSAYATVLFALCIGFVLWYVTNHYRNQESSV